MTPVSFQVMLEQNNSPPLPREATVVRKSGRLCKVMLMSGLGLARLNSVPFKLFSECGLFVAFLLLRARERGNYFLFGLDDGVDTVVML